MIPSINMKRQEIIEKLSNKIHSKIPDIKVWMYGSEARGEARPDSDIDLLVLIDGDRVTFEQEMRINEPMNEVFLDTGVLINTVIRTKKRWEEHRDRFYYNVMRDRVLL